MLHWWGRQAEWDKEESDERELAQSYRERARNRADEDRQGSPKAPVPGAASQVQEQAPGEEEGMPESEGMLRDDEERRERRERREAEARRRAEREEQRRAEGGGGFVSPRLLMARARHHFIRRHADGERRGLRRVRG